MCVFRDNATGGGAGTAAAPSDAPPAPPLYQPDFGVSGKLQKEENKVQGVSVKYAEPITARKPDQKWRLHPYKDGEKLGMCPVDGVFASTRSYDCLVCISLCRRHPHTPSVQIFNRERSKGTHTLLIRRPVPNLSYTWFDIFHRLRISC